MTSKTTLGGLMTLLAAQGLLPSGFISGEGVPSNSIGSNGWTYLNASNGDVYGNTSGTWSKVGNIAGTAGATGPAGAAFQACRAGPIPNSRPVGSPSFNGLSPA